MTKPPARRDTALDHALALLQHIPLLDAHNDLPWVIRNDRRARGDVRAYDLTKIHRDGDTDIPRLREGRVSAQFWAAYLPTDSAHPARTTLEQIDVIRQINDAYPDVFLPATKAADIARAKRLGKIASFMTVEGGVGLENSLAPLRVWHAAGARLMTLCHAGTLDWVDSCTDEARHGGLTAFGRAVVSELNRLGMIVDCAHVSPDVMRQVLDISTAPIVFSHSNALALCGHPRNVPDDVLDRVPANGGLVMPTFIPEFISEEVRLWMAPVHAEYAKAPVDSAADPITKWESTHGRSWLETVKRWEAAHGRRPRATLKQLVDHIEYIANRIGPRHLGIGSDFYGSVITPTGLADTTCYPHLLAELIRRGWSDGAIAGIAAGNFTRVFKAVEREGERLRQTESPRVGTVPELDAA